MASEHYAMTLELPALGTCDIPGRIVLYHRGGLLREIPMEGDARSCRPFLLGGFYHENLAFIDMLKKKNFDGRNADLERVLSVIRVTEAVSSSILPAGLCQMES